MQLPDAPIREHLRERICGGVASAAEIDSVYIVGLSDTLVTRQFMPETEEFEYVAHVSVIGRDDSVAIDLNGRRNLYNGPTQKRLSKFLQRELGEELGVDRFRVQVWSASSSPLTWDFGPRENKQLSRLLAGDAIKHRVIPPLGSVFTACTRYSLPFVIIRDGLVMGPSPAFPHALKRVAKLLDQRARVLDPFAGTFITRKILEEVRPDIEVTALDAVDEQQRSTGYDAFVDAPDGRFDLIVLDPLYEDLIPYIRTVLPHLDFDFVLVQTGEIADIAWNKAVESILKRTTRPVFNFSDTSRRWGKNLFVGRKIQASSTQ